MTRKAVIKWISGIFSAVLTAVVILVYNQSIDTFYENGGFEDYGIPPPR